MLRPSPNHGTQRLPNDDDDDVQLVKHLGHIITSDLTDDKDIMHQTSMYNRKANAVLSDFKHISGDLRVQIMQSYCSSFYGSQLWDLSNTIKYIMEKID